MAFLFALVWTYLFIGVEEVVLPRINQASHFLYVLIILNVSLNMQE